MGIASSTQEKFKEALESQMLSSIYPSPTDQIMKTKSRKPTRPRVLNNQIKELRSESAEGSRPRQVLKKTDEWPLSVHGAISVYINNTRSWGTGTLIGPSIVLTAGHNLYNYKEKVYADLDKMQFLPGVNGQKLPFGPVDIDQYFVSPNFIKEGKEDYGILSLSKPIGEKTGYFGLACLKSEELESKKINVTGYPYDQIASKQKTFEMWEMEGVLSQINKDLGEISYSIETDKDQSGSGVWYQEGEEYYVYAVHVAEKQSTGIATLVTQRMYDQIYEWALEVSNEKITKLEFCYSQIDADCLSLLVQYNFSKMSTLSLSWQKIDAEGAKILAQNTPWINLSQLNLDFNNIGDEGAKALVQNTSWMNLSELNLSRNNINTEGTRALAQNSSWTKISHLDLSLNHLGSEGAKALAQNTSWINLSRLNLDFNDISDEGAKALAQNTSWMNLSELNLSRNNINTEGTKALAKNSSWGHLSQLDLSLNNIDAEGIKVLAQNTSWINLSQLNLGENNLGDEGAKALAQNTSWVNLSDLNLSRSNIGDEGAKALAQNSSWTKFSHLNLSRNNIGTEGTKALAQNPYWINLSRLDLIANKIDAEGAKALAQNTSWIKLSELNLSRNNIGTEGTKALAQNTSWINLSELYLARNNISVEAAQALVKKASWIKF